MKQSLKSRLHNYFKLNPSRWIPKGAICDIARKSDLHATGEHTGRRLRELEDDGVLLVRYVKGAAEYHLKERDLAREQMLRENAAMVAREFPD